MDTDWRLTGETGRRVYHVSINHGLTTLFFFAVGFVLVGTLAPLLAGVPQLESPGDRVSDPAPGRADRRAGSGRAGLSLATSGPPGHYPRAS